MKKALAFIIIGVLALSLSACWDYSEYEDMAMVNGIGIDYNADTEEITLTIQNIEARKGRGGDTGVGRSRSQEQSSKGVVHFVTDYTIADALEKLEQSMNKKLFYGYLSVLIVGDEAGRYITKDIISFYNRTPLARKTAYLLIAKGRAGEALSTYDIHSLVPAADYITGLIQNLKNTGSAYPVTIQDFSDSLLIAGEEPVAPVITIVDLSKKSGTDTVKVDESFSNAMPAELKEGQVYINNIGVFKGSRLLGRLTEKESKGMVWVKYKNKNTVISIKNSDNASTTGMASFRVTSTKSDITPVLENGRPAFYISVRIEASLRKYSTDAETKDFSIEVMDEMEKMLSEYVKSDIDAFLTKSKEEYKTDILGLGNIFYKKYPGIWHEEYEKHWDEIFPEVPVDIDVEAKVINTGTNIIPFIEK